MGKTKIKVGVADLNSAVTFIVNTENKKKWLNGFA